MSHKKHKIILKDLDTGEYLQFSTFQEAADYINEVTGMHIVPSTVYYAVKRCGSIAKGRFVSRMDPNLVPEFDRTKVEDGWVFVQYGMSSTVLSAEKKIKWYDEDRIEDINSALKKHGCRVFWDMLHDYYGATRKQTRVEIYKKFPRETSFPDKIATLKSIIKEAGL